MKILITGASGYIAQLLIRELQGCELLLWSRSEVNSDFQHDFYYSEDLCDFEWWCSAVIPDDVKIVIHLAEMVKENKDKKLIDLVVASHCSFLEKACSLAELVVYPDTAYKYDERLGRNARSYCYIKNHVIGQMKSRLNFVSPVIHPIINSKGALGRLIGFQSKIPMVNAFCNFDARLPCLTELNLICNFRELIRAKKTLNDDWFSMSESISKLMRVEGRYDSKLLSAVLKFTLFFFLFVPAVRILLLGRVIAKKKCDGDL